MSGLDAEWEKSDIRINGELILYYKFEVFFSYFRRLVWEEYYWELVSHDVLKWGGDIFYFAKGVYSKELSLVKD